MENLNSADFYYDEISDTLTISFAPGEPATGIELSSHILLRVHKDEWRPISLQLFDYSLLMQPTEFGLRSVPLDGLADLPLEMRERVIGLLTSQPVSEVLKLSAFVPAPDTQIPIAGFGRPVQRAA